MRESVPCIKKARHNRANTVGIGRQSEGTLTLTKLTFEINAYVEAQH